MTSEILPNQGEVNLEDCVNSVSYVRINGKIRYFGEKGNAFLLSDAAPIMCAHSMPELSKVTDDNVKDMRRGRLGHVLDPGDTEFIASSTCSIVESYTAASVRASSPSLSTSSSSPSSTSSSTCSSSASTPTGRGSPEATPPPFKAPNPLDVGLPLKLPRPPAAHLPPPLPKRPPCGPPTTQRSPSVTNKFAFPPTQRRFTLSSIPEKSLDKLHRNNDSSKDSKTVDKGSAEIPSTFKETRSHSLSSSSSDNCHSQKHTVSSPTFYRSSGTLTVSISRDSSPRQGSLSSPTGPLTPPIVSSSSSSASSPPLSSSAPGRSSVLVQLKKPSTNLILAAAGVTGLLPLDSNGIQSNTPTRRRRLPSTEGLEGRSSRAGANNLQVNEPPEGHRPATPDSGIDCQLDSRSQEAVQKQTSLELADGRSRSVLPPEVSSLYKGSMTVADLVTGAIVSYRNKPKDQRKSTPPSKQENPRKDETVKVKTTSTFPNQESNLENKENDRKSESDLKKSKDDVAQSPVAMVPEVSEAKQQMKQPESRNNLKNLNREKSGLLRSSLLQQSELVRTLVAQHEMAPTVKTKETKQRYNDDDKRDIVEETSKGREKDERRIDKKEEAIVKNGKEKPLKKSENSSPFSEDEIIKDSNTNLFKPLRDNKAAKKRAKVRPRFEKGPTCGQCGKTFGIRTSRHHCRRCWRSFCEKCLPIQRFDPSDPQDETSVMSRVCSSCSREHAMENCRGRTRGLWTEFEAMRKEARDSKGLEVTSKVKTDDYKQTIHDLTLLLRKVCVTFLVETRQQFERIRMKSTTKLWDTPGWKQNKSQKTKIKEANKTCTACHRALRYLTESRDCAVCGLHFCTSCTARTLQLYLPRGTDLGGDIKLEAIRFYIKQEEFDEVRDYETSETYFTCLECEDTAARFLRILEFNQKIPELETEMFDLQRHIEHALSYSPFPMGKQKSMSAVNLTNIDSFSIQDSNIKLAHRLYDRYLRLYGQLEKIKPATGIQVTLHRHIKQAMYGFYLERREQLQGTLKRRGSFVQVAEFTG